MWVQFYAAYHEAVQKVKRNSRGIPTNNLLIVGKFFRATDQLSRRL